MRAFVLSGGGNCGALQAGALEVLFERGIRPDFLVGTSAGALNAAWLSLHNDDTGVDRLIDVWKNIVPQFFSPLYQFSVLLKLARGSGSILSSQPLYEFLRQQLSSELTFAEVAPLRLFTVAARLQDGRLKVFGRHPRDRVIDGLMATCALPPIFPPWEVNGTAYVDGGVISNLPLQIAVHLGADEIYALYIQRRSVLGNGESTYTALAYGVHSVGLATHQMTRLEIFSMRSHPNVRLHLIALRPAFEPGAWNFNFAQELISDGRTQARRYFLRQDLRGKGIGSRRRITKRRNQFN